MIVMLPLDTFLKHSNILRCNDQYLNGRYIASHYNISFIVHLQYTLILQMSLCRTCCFAISSTKMMADQSPSARSYINLKLGYRGAERQPPSALTLALTFSSIMQEKSQDGSHERSMTTEARLKAIIAEYHDHPGVLARYRIDSDKEKAILNLLCGTTEGTRLLLQSHLNHHRWRECCFTAELLKSSRWLIGACPRTCKEYMKSILTITPEIQEAFVSNVIGWFAFQVQKVKLSTRPKYRPSQSEWDRVVDYSAVMVKVKDEAKITWAEDPTKCDAILESIETCFRNRPANI